MRSQAIEDVPTDGQWTTAEGRRGLMAIVEPRGVPPGDGPSLDMGDTDVSARDPFPAEGISDVVRVIVFVHRSTRVPPSSLGRSNAPSIHPEALRVPCQHMTLDASVRGGELTQ
jgi:hypothetical protein